MTELRFRKITRDKTKGEFHSDKCDDILSWVQKTQWHKDRIGVTHFSRRAREKKSWWLELLPVQEEMNGWADRTSPKCNLGCFHGGGIFRLREVVPGRRTLPGARCEWDRILLCVPCSESLMDCSVANGYTTGHRRTCGRNWRNLS